MELSLTPPERSGFNRWVFPSVHPATALMDPSAAPLAGPSALESTRALLDRARGGDEGARDRLFARYMPILRRWAHCRLPASARDLHETDDLVQVTLMRSLARLDSFQHRGEGAFLAYLRQILMNVVRDEIRRAARRHAPAPLAEEIPDPGPSTLERALGRETLERYEAALAELVEQQREATILRLEMGFDYRQVAEALGLASADAARMTVGRALVRLAEMMDEYR